MKYSEIWNQAAIKILLFIFSISNFPSKKKKKLWQLLQKIQLFIKIYKIHTQPFFITDSNGLERGTWKRPIKNYK